MKASPKGWTKISLEEINEALAPIGARASTAAHHIAAQPTTSGYVAADFRDFKKPVFDYVIIDRDGLSFSNINSYLYRMADGETHPLIKKYAFGGYYIETTKRIYIN